MRGALYVSTPLVIRLATGAHRATDEAGRDDLELLPERLDQIDAWIAEGVLGGEQLNAADFQIGVNVSAMLLFDQLRPFIENRPGGGARTARRARLRRARSRRHLAGRMAGVATGRRRREGCRRGHRGGRPRSPRCRWPDSHVATAPRLSRSERAAQTRRELLAAAERRFFSDGYHGTTLDDIADEAGYTKGAVYSTFKSKGGLFLALFDEIVDRRSRSCARCSTRHADEDATLAALAEHPVDERRSQFLLLSIEFWVHAAREPALLDEFSDHYRRLRAQARRARSGRRAV